MAEKIAINFTVRAAHAAQPAASWMGNQIRWAVLAKYNYADMTSISIMRIQKSSGAEFTTLAEVSIAEQFYADTTGTDADTYRLVAVDINGVESEPTLAKSPKTPDTVIVWGRICRITGQPLAMADVHFAIARPPKALDAITVADSSSVIVTTGADGYFETPLVASAVYEVSSRTLGLDKKEILIPSGKDFYNITELL